MSLREKSLVVQLPWTMYWLVLGCFAGTRKAVGFVFVLEAFKAIKVSVWNGTTCACGRRSMAQDLEFKFSHSRQGPVDPPLLILG